MSRLRSSRRRAFLALSLLLAGASFFAACTLDVAGQPGSAGGSSSSSAGGSAPVCAANVDKQPCYTGAAGTEGKGICKGGQRTCSLDGSGFGDCIGEVLPAAEDDCINSIDTSCDDQLVCQCPPGMTIPCYAGPSGTENVGTCKAGTRTCNQEGVSYGPCLGQVIPAIEDCSTPEDDDCDGKALNDPEAACVCLPKSVVGCTTTLQGMCSGGTQACLATGKGYDVCKPIVEPAFDDCFSPEDEDCDGKPINACTGTSVVAGADGTTTGADSVFATASDAMGNILLGGVENTSTSGSYYPSSGAAVVTKIDSTGVQAWKKYYPAMDGYSVVRGVTADAMGNVFLVGEYRGTISAPSVSLTSTPNSVDVFVIKLDKDGLPQWSKSFGDNGDQFGYSISAAANGDVFITGMMRGSMTFGAAPLNANNSDIFVARLEGGMGMGKPVWGRNFGDGDTQVGLHVAATPDGDVVVTGQFKGDIDFGGGNIGNGGGYDIFLAKLAGIGGANVWSRRFGDNADQVGYGVAADGKGNVVITGTLEGNADFGGGSFPANGSSTDIFVARFEPDVNGTLKHKWSRRFGDTNNAQTSNAVAVDGAGNVLVAGHFKGSLQFDGVPLTDKAANSASPTDVFVAKLKASSGATAWARSFGDLNDQQAWAVAADPLGSAIVGGTFSTAIDFSPPGSLSFMSMNGTYDAFWAKLAP